MRPRILTYSKKLISFLSTLSLSLFLACSPNHSPYESGPLGPADPIFWKSRPDIDYSGTGHTGVYLPDLPSHRVQQPGEMPSSQRFAPGEAGGNQIGPIRVTDPLRSPGETLGSASGRTFSNQNLDPRSSAEIRKRNKPNTSN